MWNSLKLLLRFFQLFLFTISLISFALIANSQELQFKAITVNDGLSQHDVSFILQDSYGFIWIGTYDGLNRYDGYKIINYFHVTDDVNSLSSNRIRCLFEDSKKRIWIGTDGSGINYYSMTNERFVRVETPVNFQTILDFIETEEGHIYVATNNGVLMLIEEGNNIRAEIMQSPLNGLSVNDIEMNSDKDVLFSTSNGIWKLNAGKIKQISITEDQGFDKLYALNRKILASTVNNLLLLSEEKNDNFRVHRIEGIDGNIIRDIELSKQGEFWVGTLYNGIYRLDTINFNVLENIKASPLIETGMLSNSVICLHCDKSNTLWVGNRRGLCFANLSPKKFNKLDLYSNRSIPKHPHIRTLLVDSSFIYLGIQNQGLYQYSLIDGSSKKVIDDNSVHPLTLEKVAGKIYAGTNSGLYTKDQNSDRFRAESNDKVDQTDGEMTLFAICADKFGNEYYGTFSGLVVKRENETKWLHDEYPQTDILRGKRIFDLHYDEIENCIWIGTISDGLFKLNLLDDGNFLSLERYHSNVLGNYHIANNTVWCFHKSKDNSVWVGTDAGLLRKTASENNFSQLKIEGIVDKKIMGIQEDNNGNLWLSNSQGLIRFNPSSNEVRRYTNNDGLASNTFTEAIGQSDDGTLYFGSINGINYFKPDEIKNSSYRSTVAISDFKVHNKSILPHNSYFGRTILSKSINLTESITLNHKQNNFLFEFAGTNYANTTESLFRYKLDNYESDWLYTNGLQRFASYSNLKPGNYTFYVEASNNDRIWGGETKKIDIKILPAPWSSAWAFLVYTVLLLGLLMAFIYFLKNRQQLRHELELEYIRHKKDKEINEIKLSFFTDIAHEFKTPLSLIIGPINDLIQKKPDLDYRDFCYQIISRNTQRMMFLVNQLLDFRKFSANKNILKVSQSDLAELISHITTAFMWQAKSEEINLNINVPEHFQCFFDRDLIEKVVYNLLSNAFKFTPPQGTVEIEVKSIWKEETQIANIIIKDSGKGIPDDQKKKIFERFFHSKDKYSSGIGLHLSYTLVKAHRGEINVADSIYGGTEFIVSIPVSKDSYDEIELFESEEKIVYQESSFPEPISAKMEDSLEKESILIVEDDHDLRIYLKNVLKARYNVFEASNGLKGLNTAVKKIPDLIVSDIMMPEMDGIEMCRELKKQKETSHIPVLMLTAKTDLTQQNEGLEAGAWDYITKPFNTKALLTKIKNIIKARNEFREAMLQQNIGIELKKCYTPFDQQLIAKATQIIHEHMGEEKFTVEDISNAVGLSRMQLHRKLKSIVGYTATEFVNKIKIQYAQKMFDDGCDRINEAMDAIGMSSYSHFNKVFSKVVGNTASEYIRKRNQANSAKDLNQNIQIP